MILSSRFRSSNNQWYIILFTTKHIFNASSVKWINSLVKLPKLLGFVVVLSPYECYYSERTLVSLHITVNVRADMQLKVGILQNAMHRVKW